MDAPTPDAQPREPYGGDFDWSDKNPDVVIPEQPRSAVYWNDRGQLVIRQERSPLEPDDSFVFFNPESLPALIAAIQAATAKD